MGRPAHDRPIQVVKESLHVVAISPGVGSPSPEACPSWRAVACMVLWICPRVVSHPITIRAFSELNAWTCHSLTSRTARLGVYSLARRSDTPRSM